MARIRRHDKQISQSRSCRQKSDIAFEEDDKAQKRRVLIISQCFYPSINRGGPAVSVTNLAKMLSSFFEISVLTTAYESGSGELYQEIRPGKNSLFGCEVYYVHNNEKTRLTGLIKDARPQTIYISSLFAAKYTLPALFYAKKHSITTVLAPRGELQTEALSRKKIKKRPYLAFLKLTGLLKDVRFHATSAEEAERIKKVFPKATVFLAQNLPRTLNHPERARIKEPGVLRAVAVCRIHPIKGIDLAIKALRTVNGSVQYDVYGPAEDRPYQALCAAEAKKLPKNCTVRFCGSVQPENLTSVFSEADVFFLPTKTENFGNAIVEAMLCGCPAIISNGTPWQELSAHCAGENAETVEEYTAALNRFAAMDETQWRRCSDCAERYIRARLHTEETIAAYVNMLTESKEHKNK